MNDQTPTLSELEGLFVRDPNFDQIAGHLARFNPIRIMRADAKENRHSDILAWLLDPSETHGLGDRFLKAFVAEALAGGEGKLRLSSLGVQLADLSDAQIYREAHRIDILVLSERNSWGFIIENKFHSRQGKDQLERYRKRLGKMYSNKRNELLIQGIYLTLHDEPPIDKTYAAIRYEAVSELLPRIIGRAEQALRPDVATFLTHYVEILEGATGMNKDQHNMERLARELYLKHKKTLDFIMEHGARTDFDLAVQQLFGEDTKLFQPIGIGKAGGRSYVYTNLGKNFVGFLPTEWFQAFGSGDLRWPGCDKYWAEMPLTCWFGFAEDKDSGKGSLRLYAEVGPISDPQFRAAMIDSIRVAIGEANLSKASFRRDSTTAGKRYSRFLNNSTRKISNIQDADEIAADMAGLLREFQTVFDAVAQALPSLTARAQEDGHAQRREVRGLS